MTAKEYLSQARYLDSRINAKIQQVTALKDLATKCTSTLSKTPRSQSQNTSPMEVAICKIIDLENEINSDIDNLVDLKREIVGVIKAVKNEEYQTLLEKRYLCFTTWEQIALEMHYSVKWIHKLHERALCVADKLLNNKSVP